MASSHTLEQRKFVVRKLAAREPPREIVRNFAAVFPDTRCTEDDVRRLDPSNLMLPPELHFVYVAERDRIKNDPDAAPYADQFWRFVALSKDVEAYRNNNQPADARSAMRQIAEEQGTIGQRGVPGKADAKLATKEPLGGEVKSITRRVVDPKSPEPEATPT